MSAGTAKTEGLGALARQPGGEAMRPMTNRIDQFIDRWADDLACLALLCIVAIFARGIPYIIGSLAS